MTTSNLTKLEKTAITIHRQDNARIILAKGRSLSEKERAQDIWQDGAKVKILFADSIFIENTQSAGCKFSATACASLAFGKDMWSGVIAAKQYVITALKYSLDIGNESVGHFIPLLQRE